MYGATYGLLVRNDVEVFANVEAGATDSTYAPNNISIIRRAMIDKQYERLAVELSKTPAEVTEAELLASFGLTDLREV